MKRSSRAEIAKQTVEIVERGQYLAGNNLIEIADSVRACLASTRYFEPLELERIRQSVVETPCKGHGTAIEVVNETTLSGIFRLHAEGQESIAALNFASARNPGGGFLGGSQAQEESLARSSALYASLLQAKEYYDRHRAADSLLYSHAMILSPGCPIIRNDDGELLPKPELAAFITSAAPNAGAIANKQSGESGQIPTVFDQRCELVLALAAAHHYENLVLGAWGCGVFRNDPALVAGTFMKHLDSATWSGRFRRIVFSVLDHSDGQEIFTAFQRAVNHA